MGDLRLQLGSGRLTMARKTIRKFYRYRFQAHNPSNEYDKLFATLRSIPRSERIATVGYNRIFLADISPVSTGLIIRVLAIRDEKDYTTFDESDFSTSNISLPDNKRFAIAAHGLFISGTREFVYEYVRSGPKIEEATAAIQHVLNVSSPAFRRVRLVATPVIDERFLRDVNRLERIRVVRIDVAEPNPGWADWDDPLHELGKQSGADHVSIEATAPRSETLSKTKGIVGLLKEALKAPNSHLTKAVVQGRLPDQSSDQTLRTDRNHEFEAKPIDTDSGGSANIISVSGALSSIGETIRAETS